MSSGDSKPPWLNKIEGDALPVLICDDSSVIRVIAGPGSGKTTGLKRRVQRLIQGDAVSPDKIFIGTFTRAITKELSEALGVAIANDEAADDNKPQSVRVSTLHSHALQLLRANPTSRPGRALRFLLEYEKLVMLYDLGEELTNTDQNERQKELKRVCAAWAEGDNLATAAFVGEMQRWLLWHQGMLVDEVVNLARTGLEAGSIPTGMFDHVIIDEYQDLTAAEQNLIEKIWSRKGSLVVLGDDDQSIYAFRYNHPGGITEFDARWPKDQFTDLGIPENRRCGKIIVGLANAMMSEAGSKKPPMLPKQKYDGTLSFVYWQSLAQEIRGLCVYMKTRKDTKFLVLVPRRFIGYRLQSEVGPEALTSFQEQALEVAMVQERFALASLIANPQDRVALRTLLGFHSNGLENALERNAKAYKSIVKSEFTGLALLEAIAVDQVKPKGTGSVNLCARAKQITECLKNCPKDPHELITMLFDPALAEKLDDEDKRQKARQDLQQLHDSAMSLLQQSGDNDLQKIIERLRYRIATRLPLNDVENARIRIMTLHGAKGLEADVVIIAGMADQIIPGYLDEDPAEAEKQREECRRLLYVSATRAKQQLVVSWPLMMAYRDAVANHVRRDGGIMQKQNGDRFVKLGKTKLFPDIPQTPQTGKSWLKAELV
jgi:DNA helicase II / ATP-dependent DNA helicase PcrA